MKNLMIEKLPESRGATIGVKITGKIDSIEEAMWVRILDDHIAQHGEINLIVLIDESSCATADAIYADLIWTRSNIKSIQRLAIVTDCAALTLLVRTKSPFANLVGLCEKHFETGFIENAWRWVEERPGY